VVNFQYVLASDRAEFFYKSQDPTKQRRLLETLLSNCTFDRESLALTASPLTSFVRGDRRFGVTDRPSL
jgi:hypothetical protein